MSAHQIIVHRGAVPSGSVSVDPIGCRKLWRAVLAEQGMLALGWASAGLDESAARVACSEARSWFGSRDFHAVRALAGLDGGYIARKYRARLAQDPADRAPLRKGRGRPRKPVMAGVDP